MNGSTVICDFLKWICKQSVDIDSMGRTLYQLSFRHHWNILSLPLWESWSPCKQALSNPLRRKWLLLLWRYKRYLCYEPDAQKQLVFYMVLNTSDFSLKADVSPLKRSDVQVSLLCVNQCNANREKVYLARQTLCNQWRTRNDRFVLHRLACCFNTSLPWLVHSCRTTACKTRVIHRCCDNQSN